MTEKSIKAQDYIWKDDILDIIDVINNSNLTEPQKYAITLLPIYENLCRSYQKTASTRDVQISKDERSTAIIFQNGLRKELEDILSFYSKLMPVIGNYLLVVLKSELEDKHPSDDFIEEIESHFTNTLPWSKYTSNYTRKINQTLFGFKYKKKKE